MATYVHGKGAKLFLDNSAGTLVDLSPIVTDAKISISLATADTSHFGSNSKTYIVGQNDATSSISGLFDRTLLAGITGAFNALVAGTLQSLTLQMGPEGSATGATQLSQEVIITGIDIDAGVGNVVSATINLQRTGDTTFGTY